MNALDLAGLILRPGASVWTAIPYGFAVAWPTTGPAGTIWVAILVVDGIVDAEIVRALEADFVRRLDESKLPVAQVEIREVARIAMRTRG